MDDDIIKTSPEVTMMVADYPLSCPVNIGGVFYLLNVHRPGKVTTCKNKILPHYKIPGTIIRTDFGGETRGYIREKSKFFKNSVSIDISCIKQNANIKLSTENIHLCGIVSVDMIEEATDYIISDILEINEILEYAANNPELRDKTIEWLKDATRGLSMVRTKTVRGKNGLIVNKITKFNYLKVVTHQEIINCPDKKMAKLYLRLLPDYVYHSDFCDILELIRNLGSVTDKSLSKTSLIVHMKNINARLRFDTGVCVIFANIFKEKFPEYNILYDNTVKPSTITIIIPYIPKPGTPPRKSGYYHTFMLQSSGSFTHSGPGGEESDVGFEKFIDAMKVMEKLIPRSSEEIMIQMKELI